MFQDVWNYNRSGRFFQHINFEAEEAMNTKRFLSAVVLGVGMFAGSAMADEVTTRSTTTTESAPGLTVGVPGIVGVQIGGGQGCTTRSKTETNTDTGDSRTVSRSTC
jgi:hypothetical protein